MRFGALIVAAFLAVDPTGWDRYIPLRFALISTIAFTAIAASLGAGDSRSQPLPRWAVIGWVGVIGSMSISTVLSNDRWIALIGTPERHFGLATWLILFGLFSVSSFYPNSSLDPITQSTAVATACAGIWALLEKFDVGWFAADFADGRVGGPFGQPAYLGAAMLLAVPLCVSMAVDNKARLVIRLFGASSALLGVAALGLASSRAAWVGAGVALAAVIVRRRMFIVGVVCVVSLTVLMVVTPVGDRAATLTELDSGVVAGRLDEWQVGMRALTDTPTFGATGHGPEGYRTVFGEHVDEQYVIDYGRDVITDRAHNGFLDTALSGGLLAGAAMVLLQAGLLVTALQRLRAEAAIDVALSAAILGYLVQQFFLFPLVELDPILWIFAGLLVARRPQRFTDAPPLFREVSGAKQTAMLGAGFLAAMAAIAGLSDVAADHAVAATVETSSDVDALRQADTARSRRPDSIRYDFIAARAASRQGTLDGFVTSLERLDDGLRWSPSDPALLAERANVLLEIARRSNDTADRDAALAALADRDELDPNNPATQTSYGIVLALDGQVDQAMTKLQHASVLAPFAVEPLVNLARLQLESGALAEGGDTLDRVDQLAPSNTTAESLRREFLSE